MEFQGVVEFEELELGFEYPGRLTQLVVKRGDRVQPGALLAGMDSSLERAATEARRSETVAAEAQVALVAAGSRPEEVRALEARIRAADAAIAQLSENLRRESVLMNQGVTPRAVVLELTAEVDRAQAERDALAHNLRLLRQGPRREELTLQRARAAASAALLEAQEQRQGRFELRAPIAGDILDYHRETGETVLAGAPIVTLADTARPFAEVFVPQAGLAGIQVGTPAQVWVDAAVAPLPSRVEYVARHTEFTPRFLFSERERPNLVVRVRLRIDDPGRTLHAGVPARVRFATENSGPPTGEAAAGAHGH
jgi:HlyD family secretion protein